MSDNAAYVEPARYTVGESTADGLSAQVWSSSGCVCIVWRETSEQANADARHITNLLNRDQGQREINREIAMRSSSEAVPHA